MNTSIKEELKAIIEAFETTPTKNQTLEMCEAAVEHDGLNIKKVSKRLLSKELCVKAINNNPDAFFLLSKEFICKETLIAFFKQAKRCSSPHAVFFELEKKINRMKGIELRDLVDLEVAKAMISFSGEAIMRRELAAFKHNMEILEEGLKTWGNAIMYIPKDKITKEHVLKAIEGSVLAYKIPVEFLKEDEILDALAVKGDDYFHLIPMEERTYERYLLGVKSGLGLDCVPKECFSEELLDIAIETRPSNIEYIPLEHLNRELILKAVNASSYLARYINPKAVDEKLAYELVLKGASLWHECVRENQSQRIVDFAINRYGLEIGFVGEEFLNDNLIDNTLSKEPRAIDSLPKAFVNEERVHRVVEKGLGLESEAVRGSQTQEVIDLLFRQDYFSSEFSVEERIGRVEERFKTKEFFTRVVSLTPKAIKYVPYELLDEEMCYIAVCGGAPLTLEAIKKFQSQRIVDKAWENDEPKLLCCVKIEFRTDEVIKKAMEDNVENIHDIPRDKMKEDYVYAFVSEKGYIPTSVIEKQSKRVAEKAFELDINNFDDIRDDLKTKEMSMKAFEYDKRFIADIPEEFATEEMWIEAIREAKHPISLKGMVGRVPKKLSTDNVFKEFIKRDWRLLSAISKEFLTPELQMTAFEIDENSLQFFDI